MKCVSFSFFLIQNVSGQVVLITGGGGGVGVNLARNFATLNARVVIWDINAEGKFGYNFIEADKNS